MQMLYTPALVLWDMLTKTEIEVRSSKTLYSQYTVLFNSSGSTTFLPKTAKLAGVCVIYKILHCLESEAPTCKIGTKCPFV